jgi:O-antigen/teichoic acid export membrane protein
VGLGVAVSAGGTYLFLALSARAVGPESFVAFTVGWALLLVVAAGLLVPLEQEGARLVARARALGTACSGARAVLRRAALRLTCLSVVGVALAAPALLLMGLPPAGVLAVALAAVLLAPAHLLRGLLAGQGAFGRYAALLALEAGARLLLAAAAVVVGLSGVPALLLVVGLGSGAAAAALWTSGERGCPSATTTCPGPAERTTVLAAAAVAAQVVLNSPPVVAALLASAATERRALAPVLAAAALARVPLFAFTAVQATLVPALSRQVATGDRRRMLATVRVLLVSVALITALFCLAALAVGQEALVLVFGEPYRLGGGHLALLGAASGAYLLAASGAAALIALDRHRDVLSAWATGLAVLLVVVALVPDLVLRVELGLLGGCAAAAAVLLGQLLRAARPVSAR